MMKLSRLWTPFFIAACLVASVVSFNAAHQIKSNGQDVTIPTVYAIQAGDFAVAAAETNKTITFAAPMPDKSYKCFFNHESGLSVTVYYTARTTTNVTVRLSRRASGIVSYLVIDY